MVYQPESSSDSYCAPLAKTWAGVKAFLQLYCAQAGGGLVQGGAASPYLFHIYACALLDDYFWVSDGSVWSPDHPERRGVPTWCYRHNIRYLRLSDDLLFVSPRPIGNHKRAEILRIIRQAGFEPSSRKTAYYDLQQGEAVINGAGLQRLANGRLRTFMPAERRRRLEAMMHRAVTRGDVPAAVVHGHMGWFYQLVGAPQRDWRSQIMPRGMTASELRIHELYQKFKAVERQNRRQQQEA